LVTVLVAVEVAGVIEAVAFILWVGLLVMVCVDVEFADGYDGTSYVLEHPTTKTKGSSVATIKQQISFFIFTSLLKKFGRLRCHEIQNSNKSKEHAVQESGI
jgi:hypothetical protein